MTGRSMALGTKTLIGLGASFAIWCLLLYQANTALVRPSFEALEVKTLERNCERARKAFADQAQTLSSKVGDWALWDDTYEFIESRAQEYVTANLNAESLETLHLDFMVFVNAGNEIVHLALRGNDVGTTVSEDAVRELLRQQPRILQHGDPKSSHRGLMPLGRHTLMLASRPIHRSDLSGDSRGCMLAGRILDGATIAALANLTQLSLTVSAAPQHQYGTVIERTADDIRGSIGLLDMFGTPIATCSVQMPREITREGESALRLLLVALLISSGLALLTTLWGIDRCVLRRLRTLRTAMNDIIRTGDLGKKVVLRGRDEISDLAGSLNDLTDRLSQTQQHLIHANEARSQFLANVSHEVRTPVTAMLGFIDLMQDDELPRAQQQDFVRTIRRNAQHLLTILNDLLDTAKIESGQMAVDLVSVDLPELLRECADLARPSAARKELDFHLEQRTPLPQTIRTDPTRLRQILANLLGNAVKFTERGSVRLVAAMTASEQLSLAVIDTGIGVPTAQQDRLFKPFAQADATTSRRFGGTGLGLVLSRNLARCLGGEVAMQSTPGVGSTFTVTLPTGPLTDVATVTDVADTTTPAARPVAAAPLTARLEGRRILVVDDAPDNRRLVSFVLQKAGARIELAENGRVGVDMVLRAAAHARPFDLVVMDMQMPVLDGYGATAELRQRGMDLPILALTANAMQADLEACLKAGCNSYATKPIDKNNLVSLIELLVSERDEDGARCGALSESSGAPESPESPESSDHGKLAKSN